MDLTYASRASAAATNTSSTTTHSSDWAAGAIAVLLDEGVDHFFQMASTASASNDHAMQDLLVMAENLLVVTPSIALNGSAQLDAERIVHVFTVLGDIASAGLSEDEERRYQTPGGTVMHVTAPSEDRLASGFVLGPFTVPPLEHVQQPNTTVQVISWATNLFDEHDMSDTMLTISVRTNGETLALKNLATPLKFTLAVDERMAHSGTDAFHRGCVFWNTTSRNWRNFGLQVVRKNLTQVDMVVPHRCVAAARLQFECTTSSLRAMPVHGLAYLDAAVLPILRVQ